MRGPESDAATPDGAQLVIEVLDDTAPLRSVAMYVLS
jgi:hypothetical protein